MVAFYPDNMLIVIALIGQHNLNVKPHGGEMEKQTYSVAEAGQILGLGRNGAYDAVKRGEIPVIRFGKRRLRVPKAAVERLLQGAQQ